MANKPTIAIVGPGRLGTALVRALDKAGFRITQVLSQNKPASRRKARTLAGSVRARAATVRDPDLNASLVWFCVPDRAIASAASSLAKATRWKGKLAFHSSGALPSDELVVLRRRGAAVASIHPMMTFVSGSVPSLRGVPFALEGDPAAVRAARKIAQAVGGEPFMIHKRDKAAYHAWGAFTSPLLVAALVTGEQVARAAGLTPSESRKKLLPIVRQTLENYGRLGPAGAFSGPLIRGDVETVRKHLRVLKKIPEAKEVYVALARAALRHLPAQQRRKLERTLRT